MANMQEHRNKCGKLSAKTILKHQWRISMVLEQAVKEGLVLSNVARCATLLKSKHKRLNGFQPEQGAAIRDTLEQETI